MRLKKTTQISRMDGAKTDCMKGRTNLSVRREIWTEKPSCFTYNRYDEGTILIFELFVSSFL